MPLLVHEPIIGLPDFKIISYQGTKTIEINAEYIGARTCIHFGHDKLRKKDGFIKVLKHHSIGINKSVAPVFGVEPKFEWDYILHSNWLRVRNLNGKWRHPQKS